MNENGIRDPIADLEQRWAAEKSSQLALQLAEEHRRVGNLERAIEVLRQGLEHHPRHVAARVALGRYLLESGNPAGASAALQSVVDEDPTHLVANKVLVSTALDLGDTAEARRRLEIYEALNASDQEIEALRLRLDGAPSGIASVTTEGSGVTAGSSRTSVPGSGASGGTSPPERSDEGPFAGLMRVVDRDRYRRAIWQEGVFGSPVEAAHPAVKASRRPAEATVTLGHLYLDQGHHEEAERIFRAVLEMDPGNHEALDGLREASGARSELRVSDLVDGEMLAVASPRERKRLILEAYRERLRARPAKG